MLQQKPRSNREEPPGEQSSSSAATRAQLFVQHVAKNVHGGNAVKSVTIL